jgi:hypothetical protein
MPARTVVGAELDVDRSVTLGAAYATSHKAHMIWLIEHTNGGSDHQSP